MNRKTVNGSNENKSSVGKIKDECDTNSTDSFDMNDFKATSLNKKYSVQIHKNKADLMAELNNINIMGDESDVEYIEPTKTDHSRLNASISDANSSKITDHSLNITNSSDGQSNGDLVNAKQERILAWAQSQSQSLSLCVASILSDHDYLSQENLLGIITGNEEHFEIENRSQKLSEINENKISNNDLPKEPNADSQATIIYTTGTNGDTQHSDSEDLSSNNINELNAIMEKLTKSKQARQRMSLLDEIMEKSKKIKEQMAESQPTDEIINKDPKENQTAQPESTETPDFSPNHSEPMEYYGNTRLSTQTSVEESKESEGDDLVSEVKNGLKTVGDMANRISVDTKAIHNRLVNIEAQSEPERNSALEKLRENFALLVEDMANELTKIAVKLNPKAELIKNDKSDHKSPDKMSKSRSLSNSTDDDNYSESYRKSRKLKRRRKLLRSQANISSSTSLSSNSEDLPSDKHRKVKQEPIVITQDLDDLMNGGASNSANESLTKENDLLGFENVDDVEIGIKTEVMLNSESMLSQNANTQKSLNLDDSETSKENSVVNENTAPTMASNEKEVNVSTNSAIEEMDRLSSSTNLSDNLDDDGDDDDDDEEIRKLLDFSSISSKRIASTSAAARVNGIVVPQKPTKKVQKEDKMAKFLAESEDASENPIESEEEKSDREEYTEEQYLKEQNLKLKQQLLQSSSDSEQDDSDTDDNANGRGSAYSSEIEDDNSVNSGESLIEEFLASESKSSGRKSPSDNKKQSQEEPKESNDAAAEEKQPDLKTKEKSPKKRDTEKIDRIDDDPMSDSDFEFDNESGSISLSDAPKKSKSTVGQNVFKNLEKDHRIMIPSDDEDMSESESKKKRSGKRTSEADSSGNNSEILDTSMFKSTKKDFNTQQLSRILPSSRNKQSTSRVSPECISVSSDDDLEMESTSADKKDDNEDEDEEKEKRGKRKLLRHDQLADDTKLAQKEESDRIKRLDKKNERLTQFMESQRLTQGDAEPEDDSNEVVLDIDTKKDEQIIVHREITKHLKAHQVEGVKFMYDCCYGSVDNLEKYPGSGCILAHCMGLGKTLQLITLLHTVISYPQLKTDKVLVICPKSTVMNWKDEIERWLSPIKNSRRLKLFHFPEASDVNMKLTTLKAWSQCGKDGNKQAGCLLLGYEAFRVLVFYHNSKKSKGIYAEKELENLRKSIHKYLLDPGADLVVCDEGHMIKNQKSTTSMAVNKIITKRRIVLTGTPIQNNLKEYYSMVNFIKPSFLGTEKEFANLYVNPIKNGQHKDSSKSEIKYMKQRSYVLHKKLSRFVQRKEAALLKSFLPDKFEYVLFIPMTKIQTDLYEFFLANRPNQDQKGKSLIPDYTVLRKIWTHPKVLENAYLNAIQNKTKVKPTINANANANANANDSDEDQPDDVFDSQTGQMSVTSDWWREHLNKEDLETILPSNKLKILFEILNQCRRNKEKCLIFSAFVAVLDVVEFFMRLINDQEKEGNKPGLETFRGPWVYGQDYYRLDGKTAKNQRHSMITSFNNPSNERTRVFLISAKAGGQGINLIGANRVVLLDTSWNPSNDQQNIFRVFRLGQKRVCYIYRLLSMGTMEEKVYSRSVTKQAMSCRVMDEQQIDRHYNMAELTELYILTTPSMAERPTPNLPKDDLLAGLLLKFPHMVYKYHEHDSLLENKGEEELSEQEKNDAWAAYEEDVKRKNESNMGPYNNSFGMLPNYSALGTYANSMFSNYNNLSGVSGLNYPYNMYSQYPYANDSHWQFNDYSSFYNNLMAMGRSSMSGYNQSSTNLLSPNHSTSVSSPPPLNMNNFPSSRNWMQSNASSSNYANSLLSSLAQSSSSSKSSYASYLNSLYNAIGSNNPPAAATASSNANPSTSKTPPLPLTSSDFNALAYLQKAQNMSNIGATNPISSTTSLASNSSLQHGPNALRNPLLTKELSIPRNPTMATTKDMFNLPIPTSVITKTTTSSSSTLSSIMSSSTASGSNQNETSKASKSSSKSPDVNISSTIEKTATKPTKNTTEKQITIKDVTTINNESRDSPDTTGNNQLQGKTSNDKDKASVSSVNNGVSSTVSATVDSTKKANKAPTVVTPISTNMGIVYPPHPAQTASTSKGAPVLVSTNAKLKDKDPVLKTASGVTLNKSNQPMPAIIRKPIQSNSKSSDPTNDAVAAINKNKALTVTARNVVASASKVPPVNNSITLSPIPNPVAKFGNSSVSITPTQGRTQSPLLKPRASPIPVAISKVPANINQTTITKSPTPVSKTNGLGTRSTNTYKVSSAVPKIVPSSTRTLNSNPSTSPKVMASQRLSQTSQPFKPIIAQTKAQVLASQNVNKTTANSSGLQINRVTSKQNQPSLQQNSSSALATKLSALGVEMRKRPAVESITPGQAKKSKPTASPIIPSSSKPGSQKSQNSLQGIRLTPRPQSQAVNSQITPVEIVELE